MMTFNELQQIGSVKEKQDRSEDRALWPKKNCRWHRTYEQRLDKLGLWTLEERGNTADLLEIFKLIKGCTDVSWTRFFTRIDNRITRGHNWKLMEKHNCCDLRHHFFSQRAESIVGTV